MPDALLQRVAAEATANNRSTTAEIVSRLEASGMTLRDHFAGHALVALLSSTSVVKKGGVPLTGERDYAEAAFAFADAMLNVRSKPPVDAALNGGV